MGEAERSETVARRREEAGAPASFAGRDGFLAAVAGVASAAVLNAGQRGKAAGGGADKATGKGPTGRSGSRPPLENR